MKTRTLKIITGILTAVTTLTLLDLGGGKGAQNEVKLQSPSLVYASVSSRYSNTSVFGGDEDLEEAERRAEEADTEEESDLVRTNNPDVFNLEDYTITAPANYQEIAERVRGEEPDDGNDEKKDGKYIWTKSAITKVYAQPNASSKVIANFKQGTKVMRISHSGDWSYIRVNENKKGYILSSSVSSKKVSTPTPTPKASKYYTPQPKKNCVYIKGDLVYARSGPGITYQKMASYRRGTEIVVASTTANGWIKTDKGYYIKKDLTVNYPIRWDGKKATPTPTPKPSAAQLRYMRLSGFVRYVGGYVGCRYVYGGSTPSGFDCSGFSMYCYYRYYGIKLPHGANMQMHRGRKVSLSALQAGDLIFFDHDHNGRADHVGIYVGGGKLVHASNPRTGVIKVSLSGKKDIIAARRYI
ncbi:MAG: C40 family peptidase [Clostridiales bacterium]|nr:C40 family peptidase [Clostridiales bacterium]